MQQSRVCSGSKGLESYLVHHPSPIIHHDLLLPPSHSPTREANVRPAASQGLCGMGYGAP